MRLKHKTIVTVVAILCYKTHLMPIPVNNCDDIAHVKRCRYNVTKLDTRSNNLPSPSMAPSLFPIHLRTPIQSFNPRRKVLNLVTTRLIRRPHSPFPMTALHKNRVSNPR